MKTIIYLGGFELPDRNAAAQRALSLSKSFRDLGYRVIIFGLDKDLYGIKETKAIDSNINNIEMIATAYPSNFFEWYDYLFSCKKESKILEEITSVSAIVCYNYPSIALFKLNKFCIANNTPLIADVTEWYPPSSKKFPFNLAKDLDTVLRMKYVQPRLKNVVCISRFLYDYYKDKVENCVFVPSTIDKEDKKWNTRLIYRPNKIFTLGYAGNPGKHCEKERIDLLIKAVCHLNEDGYSCQLKLAGFDQLSFEVGFPEIVNGNFHKECICYLGKISHKECLQLISSVDYTVIMREDTRVTKAGFPTKLSESFACGTPVITTPSSNIVDFVVEGENGIITEDFSYGALINALKKAITLGKNRINDMHKFAWEKNPLEYKKYNENLENFISSSMKNGK